MTTAAVSEEPGGRHSPLNPERELIRTIQLELQKAAAYGLRVSLGKDATTLIVTPIRRYREEIRQYTDQPSIDSITKKADDVDRLLAKNETELRTLIARLAPNYAVIVNGFIPCPPNSRQRSDLS